MGNFGFKVDILTILSFLVIMINVSQNNILQLMNTNTSTSSLVFVHVDMLRYDKRLHRERWPAPGPAPMKGGINVLTRTFYMNRHTQV